MSDAAKPPDAGSACHPIRRFAAPAIRVAFLVVLVTLSPCHLVTLSYAQAPPADGTFYAQRPTFQIPFVIDPGETRIREVQLYVRGADGRWDQVGTARPGDTRFPFTAPRDGWYDFTIRTIDRQGQAFPPTLEQAQVRLRVCVDTVRPEVSLRSVASPEGPAAVAWEVRDDNLDPESLRLEWRVVGAAEWNPLGIQRAATGQRAWNPATNAPVEVRLQARDLAGNAGEAVSTLTPGALARPAAEAPGAGVNVRIVNSKRISINYDVKEIGKSGIAVIELWYTRNEGRTWQKYNEKVNPEAKDAYTFEAAEEGLYGFTLVARNRAGFGEPAPKVGDAPQVYVEVDLTKPVVRLQSVDVGRGAEMGSLTITYSATDKNLAPQPITLAYAEKPEGPWQSIAGPVENAGRYVWRIPETVPYQFYVRVEAADRAGNVGAAETAKPVIVDLSQPKVQVIGVAPGGNP
jgi:hypothetical protein